MASLKFWFVHGGPHLLWLGGLIFGMVQLGVIETPAWSSDIVTVQSTIQEVREEAAQLRKSVDGLSIKIDELSRDVDVNKVERIERERADKERWGEVNNKLDLLLNHQLNNGNRRQ